MTDDINLPPLPDWFAGYSRADMHVVQAYARAAIEYFLNQSGQYITNDATRQAAIDDAIKADRKRRGEPESNLLTKFFAALDQATALDSKQSQWSNKTVGSHHERVIAWAEVHRLRGLLAPQPAAPAQEPFLYLRTLNGKPDWSEDCVADCESDLIHDEEMYAEGYGVMPLYTAPQPAAPAQEPSDDDLHNLWSRSGGVMRTFARALLARYGNAAQPSAPEGWKLVPIDPDGYMEAAAEEYWNEMKYSTFSKNPRSWAGVYETMLAAAPTLPVVTKGDK